MSTFLRASNSQADIKSMALAAFGSSGIVLAVWYSKDAWLFSGVAESSLTQSAVSGVAVSGASVNLNVSGFVAATSDGSSGAYLCQDVGALIHYASGGTLTGYALPSGMAFVGAHYSTGQSAPYMVNASGALYVLSGATIVPVLPSSGFNSPSYLLAGSGSTLFSLLASASGIGTFALSSLASGASGFISAPMTVPTCLAVPSGGAYPLAAGGWTQAFIPSGFSSQALTTDPQAQTVVLGATSGAGALSLWTQGASGIFSFTQAITGLSNPSFVTWNASGTQAMVCDPVSGHVYVAAYSLGVLSISQTLSVTGATQAAMTPAGDWAFITQKAQNQIQLLRNTGVWAAAATIALSGANAVVSISPSGMAIGGSSGAVSGVFYATLTSAWALSSGASLGFVPGAFSEDTAGNLYAVGTSGASGILAEVSGSTVVGSGSWVGSVAGVLWEQGQIVVTDPTAALIRMFAPQYSYANSAISFVQTNAYAQPSGTTGVGPVDFSTPYLLVGGSSRTSIWQFAAPYSLSAAQSGVASIYNGSGWASVSLGIGHVPEAMAFDPSGNISVVTLQNDLYTLAASGAIISSGAVTQDVNQLQTTPIGMSKLLWLNGHLYASSSLNEALIQIV